MKSKVKTLHFDPPANASTHSPPLSPVLSSGKVSDQARTLLLADDDWVLREFEAEILGEGGYTVLKATGAEDAILLARTAPIIHLLLTDFSMRGFDGLELTSRFRELHPETPVLMFRGSFPLPSHKTEKLKRFGVLCRPFEIEQLLHRVRSLLNAAAPLPIRKPLCANSLKKNG